MGSVTSNPSTAGTLTNRAQGLLTIRIEPPRKWLELRLKELWTHRELLYSLVWRDVKVRYKQTAIGVCAFHQNHDYGYHPEVRKGVWEGGKRRRSMHCWIITEGFARWITPRISSNPTARAGIIAPGVFRPSGTLTPTFSRMVSLSGLDSAFASSHWLAPERQLFRMKSISSRRK
jgi:hypothetical protein